MSSNLKILHVITGLARGGAEGALYRLCTVSHIDAITVVSLNDEGIYGSRLRETGVDVYALGMRSPGSLFTGFFQLRRLLKSKQPDVVQTWMYHSDLIGGLAAWSLGIPVCWGVRNGTVALNGKWTTRLVAKMCAAVSSFVPWRIVSCSRVAVSAHKSLGYNAPFEVVPNGYDLERWDLPQRSSPYLDLGFSSGSFVFAHAARAHRQKDHATLATAFSLAHDSNPSLRLVLCGDGLSKGSAYFESLPFSPSARSSVLPLGPRDDLPALWQLADAFVLSSIVEGFPNVVAEAMASGLPCVVTDAGDAAEIVGNTGYVVPVSDPCALAVAVLKMSTVPIEERAELSAAARRRIADNFTLKRMAEGFKRVWSNAVLERRKACAG